MIKIIAKNLIILLLLFSTSCAALSTSISKRNLEIASKMQQSIFLDPVPANLKTVFIQVKNTSEKQDFNIDQRIIDHLKEKGYKIVKNPKNAFYILQINILQVGQTSQTALEQSPFGVFDAAGLGVAGSMIGGRNNNVGGTVIGAIIGAGGSVIANSLVKDIYFKGVVDLKIKEGNFAQYQSRILATANKVNLKWQDAKEPLEDRISQVISGIF